MPKIALTIYLVKKNVTAIDQMIKAGTSPCPIDGVGTLYYKESFVNEARKIQDFFGNTLPQREGGSSLPIFYTANVQAVLMVKRQIGEETITFFVTFGLGRNLINTDCIQEKFGMRVVLNSIAAETVRSVDINVLESVPKQDKIQLSKDSRIDLFNLDPERDLVRALTGLTKEEYKNILGERVTGADPLRIAVDITINQLPARLEEIYRLSMRDYYRSKFGFIDKISPIKDNDIRNVLNGTLIQLLEDRQLNLVWLSIPELVDWAEIDYIRYFPKKGNSYCDLDINTLLDDVYQDDIISIEKLKGRKVYAYNTQDIQIYNWNVYRCLCADLEHDGKQYILSNGQWYLIATDFAQEINDYYNSAEIANFQLENSKSNEKEGDYNLRVTENEDNYLLMDKRLVQPANGLTSIEFCDIYTVNKELIHVKRHTSSATLSHLFNQGYVSAELLIRSKFRERLNEKIKEIERDDEHKDLSAWKVEQRDQDFNRGDYTIVFAIISEGEGDRPSIPFFSKVAFRQVSRRLIDLGYHVSLMKIGINHDIDADPELTARRNNRNRRIQNRRH